MSGGFSLFPEMVGGFGAGVSGSTMGTAVQGGTGASNTKGSWVQLTASSSIDATWMYVSLWGDNSANANCNNFLVDIGVGAAASEVVIAPNLHMNSFFGTARSGFILPVTIPAGTRISARSQADATSLNSVYVSVMLFDSGYTGPIEGAGLDDMGTNTSNSQLTAVTTGTSGAKGSYFQLTASTAKDYAGLLIAPTVHSGTNSFVTLLDIAVGAAASEQIIVPDIPLTSAGTVGNFPGYLSFPFFVPIPAGTRLSARASVSTVGAASAFQVAAYGIPQ